MDKVSTERLDELIALFADKVYTGDGPAGGHEEGEMSFRWFWVRVYHQWKGHDGWGQGYPGCASEYELVKAMLWCAVLLALLVALYVYVWIPGITEHCQIGACDGHNDCHVKRARG
jgi:hypothetical protein